MTLLRPPLSWLVADLAPGDARSAALDLSAFEALRLPADHPWFAETYTHLWEEFGAKHEIETRDVLARRLAWNPANPINDCSLLYEMIALRKDGKFAAARDHTAIVVRGALAPAAVVHLSHVLVAPEFRRTGLAGWLRALPIQAARACLAAAACPADSPITLVAEMESLDKPTPDRVIRLRAYEKAGFKKIDPVAASYLQPDFRSPQEIDASGGPCPLPFWLIVRRVGRESETQIRASEVRALIDALYRMYAVNFRAEDMNCVWRQLEKLPAGEAVVRLLPPTA